ncbi:glycoside hydrolase family 71/99 protein [Flavicella marina]|uniref:hypothetical protein n=1 Tax=Flavicella marina TaxID=1475951 RepID=UPI0012645C63|nr:hypothetical protein [Flavicella marina]
MLLLKIKQNTHYLFILFIPLFLSIVSCSTSAVDEEPCVGDECNKSGGDGDGDGDGGDSDFYIGVPSTTSNKVYMHYLSWFGEGSTGNHWKDGTANEPLIGYYSSKSWATHLYHILLSSAVGVDGAIINVRTSYDEEAFGLFIESLKRVQAVYPEFDYSVAISYDDQDMTVSLAKAKMTDLKNNVITSTTKYLHRDGSPVIFIWDYEGYLSSQDYRDVANEVFAEKSPILLKNELDLDAVPNQFVMNSIYPWVQGFEEDGSNWGEVYLDWFYNTAVDFKINSKMQFVTGAVWAGFDDRNASWGQNRWIDRKEGALYNDVWSKVNTGGKDIDWVILETWNDFNEGTELEPITGNGGYKYMDLTATNIATFKSTDSNIDAEKYMFGAPVQIYKAAKLIENGNRNYNTFYPKLELAIEKFLQKKGEESFNLAEEIIDNK